MRKKYLVLTTVFCLSMMLFAGCGNNNSTENSTGTEATASPGSMGEDDANGAIDDIGEGAKDVIDGAEDAVDGAADGTKKAIDGVTDDEDDASRSDSGTNNSVTDGTR